MRTESTDRESIPELPNRLGIEGIEFIEYATSRPQALGQVLENMGFRPVARHRSREVTLYRQGGLNVVVNAHPADAKGATLPETPQISAIALRVRDAEAETRVKFTGIDYFPVDTAFRYTATFTPHDAGRTIDIVNILGMVEPMMNPGTVTFSAGEQTFTLEAIDEGDHRLFLVFADRTSGKESYAAARFLYAEYPGADGKTVVDFNKAYNPPCAFTAFSTCPMPPPENRMDMAVIAGEKKPRKITP